MRVIAISLMMVCLLCGCKTTPEKVVFNSLASVAFVADEAFKAYVDLAVQEKVKPETFKKVGAAYTKFQAAFNTALSAARFSKNANAPQNVIDAASTLLDSIGEARGAGL